MKGRRIGLLIALAVLLLPCAAWAEPERIAIVVGAKQAPSGRPALRYAHNDAESVARVLEHVAGFRSQRVRVLLDPTPDALISALDGAIAELGRSRESLLFFYYSGHADGGMLFPGGRALSLAKLRERLDDPRVTLRLGIIDSCRGGGWTGAKGLKEVETFDVGGALALNNEGSVLIASSSGVEDAHESEALQGSFFTHHFSAGLRGAADDNRDSRVTLLEAFEYAKELTIRDTARLGTTPQHPSFSMNVRGQRDLPLANLTRGQSFMALEQEMGPLQVVDLGSGVVLLELKPGARKVRIAVPPGRYLVRRRHAGRNYAREYVVAATGVTRVAEAQLELVGEPRLVRPKLKRVRTRYYLNGAAGAHEGLTHAFSESATGRLSYQRLAATLNLAAISSMGAEISFPGRLGWRFRPGRSVELVPWLGVPYYITEDPSGDTRFSVDIGLGMDTWLELAPRDRVGVNLGASALGDAGDAPAENTGRAWLALGYQRRFGKRWLVNLGAGYARNFIHESDSFGQLPESIAASQIGFGSVATDGAQSMPLLGFQLLPNLGLGLFAQGHVNTSDGSFGYEVMFGSSFRFGELNTWFE